MELTQLKVPVSEGGLFSNLTWDFVVIFENIGETSNLSTTVKNMEEEGQFIVAIIEDVNHPMILSAKSAIANQNQNQNIEAVALVVITFYLKAGEA